MPLRLNVGVSRKLGLPEYSSVGASCNIEVELDASLLQNDIESFQAQVRSAFIAAQRAVDDELVRLQTKTPAPLQSCVPMIGRVHRNGAVIHANGSSTRPDRAQGRADKPATASQVKAIYAIARSQHADLEALLTEEFGVERPEDLALPEASRFIDRLKAVATS